MLGRRLALGEDASAFERNVDLEVLPRQLCRIALGGDVDLAAARIQPIPPGGDFNRDATGHAIVFEQMPIGGDPAKIVYADAPALATLLLRGGPPYHALNAHETIDGK